MNRKKVEAGRERRLLTAMIMSRVFLMYAVKAMDLSLVESELFRTVAGWCIDYFKQYGKAPRRHVEDIYNRWAEDNDDKDLVDAIKDFLEGLSREFEAKEELNVSYYLDDLRQFLTKRRLAKLREGLEYAMSSGDVAEAEKEVAGYRSVQVGQEAGFDPLNDDDSWEEAFADPLQPLIRFPGDAGKFFDPIMTRDALVGICAPEKTGKTWLCVELVMRLLRERRKVALFEVGDLSKSQILMRMGIRLSGRPLWKSQLGEIDVPTGIEFDETEDIGYAVKTSPQEVNETVTKDAVRRARRSFRRACGHVDGRKYIMTSVHASGTINVSGIRAVLEQWEQEHGFVADAAIIDYADILDEEEETRKMRDPRDKVNATWLAMRRLSQEKHILVATPTQVKALAYSLKVGEVLGKEHFSEDKRKLAHVTAMLGLNSTWEEREKGGMRINTIIARESPFKSNKPLHVGTCLALGKAICCAKLPE